MIQINFFFIFAFIIFISFYTSYFILSSHLLLLYCASNQINFFFFFNFIWVFFTLHILFCQLSFRYEFHPQPCVWTKWKQILEKKNKKKRQTQPNANDITYPHHSIHSQPVLIDHPLPVTTEPATITSLFFFNLLPSLLFLLTFPNLREPFPRGPCLQYFLIMNSSTYIYKKKEVLSNCTGTPSCPDLSSNYFTFSDFEIFLKNLLILVEIASSFLFFFLPRTTALYFDKTYHTTYSEHHFSFNLIEFFVNWKPAVCDMGWGLIKSGRSLLGNRWASWKNKQI